MRTLRARLRWELETHMLKLLPILLLFACMGVFALPYLSQWVKEVNPITKRQASARATAVAEIKIQVAPIDKRLSDLRGVYYLPTELHLHDPNDFNNILDELPRYQKKRIITEFGMMLTSFNFISPEFDLEGYMNQDNNGILGFYRLDTDEIYIVSEDNTLNASEEVVYAHEFAHALQDQHFGLPEGYDFERQLLSFEGKLPYLALVEGEARFLEQQFLNSDYFTDAERDAIIQDIYTLDPETKKRIETIPPTLINGVQFPYVAGSAFIATLYESGSWEAVNAAWENPPRSTEHILHPERYLAGDDPPRAVLIPFPGQPWRSIDAGVLGEFYLREHLGQQLTADEVNTAATGWGGDAYQVFAAHQSGDDDVALVYHSIWDTEHDKAEFFNGYITYANRRYGEAGQQQEGFLCWQDADATCLQDRGERIVLVWAPDLDRALKIMSTQQ